MATPSTRTRGTKSAEDLASILDHLRDTTRPTISRIAGTRSCLQTCSVVDQVLRAFGYQPQTLGVIFQIYNEVCVGQVMRSEDINPTAPGAFARQVGGGLSAGYVDDQGWEGAGHVVNLVPEFDILIDLSIDQVNVGPPDGSDPEPRDLGVLPFYAKPPADRLKAMRWGRKPLSMIGDGENGKPFMLTYVGVPTDQSYKTAPTYLDPMWTRIAEKTVREISDGRS